MLTATIFDNVGCATATTFTKPWPDFVKMLGQPATNHVKTNGKLLKLARVGNKRKPNPKQPDPNQWSLKHDGNMVEITGIEGDYDAGAVSVERAIELLEAAGIRATVYTSWSDGLVQPPKYNGGPRWRVLLPLSKPHQPQERERLMARLNGALGGILAAESFTLSQGYFFDKRPGAAYKCISTFDDPEDGTCIDELPELDAISIGKRKSEPAANDNGKQPNNAPIGAGMFEGAVAREGRLLASGDGRRELLKSYIASRSARGLPAGDIRLLIDGIAARYFDPDDPLDEKNIGDLVDYFAKKDHVPPCEFSGLLPAIHETVDPDTGEITQVNPTMPRAGFAFVSAGELLTDPKPTRYLVDELLEDGSLALLFAPPSAGKSFLALSWSACIATGTPWMGRDVQQGPVFYLAGEGHAGIARRLKAWELHHGVSLTDAPIFVSKVPAALMDVASAASVVQAIQDLELAYGSPALIVVDTFARNMGTGDENSNADIGTFVNHLDRMKGKLGCSVLLVHHSGHMEKDRARGGSALNAAMDASFQLEPKVGEAIVLTQRKAKESEPCKPMQFELQQVPLPGWLDSKGREMQSAVLVEKVGTPSDFRVKPLTPAQQQGMEAFYRAAAEHGTPEDMGLMVAVQLEHWCTEFYKTATSDTPDAKRKAFQRVRTDLVNMGRVTVLDDVYRVDATDIGLQCARLVDSAMQKGAENHLAGHGT